MSTQLKLRRGTTAQHSTFTGAIGEITIDTDKKTVVVHDGTTPGGRALSQFDPSGSNRIINGGMQIDQRNAGAAQIGVSSGAYICDRFPFITSQNGKWSLQQISVSDMTGFTKSAYVTINTPYTTGAADYAIVDHKIEGFNTADFAWGTANAQPVTLSFKVKTNVTGTYGVTVLNGGATRGYCATYTVSTSGVWTTATITIPGDTTGTWATDNSTGIWLRFSLGSGSNSAFPAVNTWGSSFGYQPSGGAVISGNSGGYWQITGVQLEAGSVATPFEFRPYGQELALCQRYYEYGQIDCVTQSPAAGSFSVPVYYKVTKRSSPTVVFNRVAQAGAITSAATTLVFAYSGQDSFHANYTLSGAGGGNASENWSASAEL